MRKLAYSGGLALCITVAVVLLSEVAGEDGAAHGAPRDGRAAQLERELGPGAEVAMHRETGRVRFIGTAPGRPIASPPGLSASASPTAIARAFVASHAADLGLSGGAEGLRVADTLVNPGRDSTIRFQQEVGGVPVMAGELAVTVDLKGRVLSLLGEIEPDRVKTTAEVTSAEARRTAIASVARGASRSEASLRASEPRLAIYDSRLLGGPGLDIPLLVWQVEATSTVEADLRRLVLVDAKLGVVTEVIDLIETAKDRRVCDAANTSGDYPCAPPYDRSEGSGETNNDDIDLAYDYAGDTYDFFLGRFGRDSLDGAGLPLISTVRWCDPRETCPYANAFWDGSQMVYGQGFAAADDVVGHELSHGFTQFTSNLFYWYQSGAINESMSDVFGEFVDLTNGAGTDTSFARWLIGEDIPGIAVAIRDMQDPAAFNEPDRMTSSRYVADVDQVDSGGVHTNSGVNNKAAYLIADGDTFNGKSVTGIGIDKAARVYYEAESALLTSGSDYADLYEALQQACINSIGGREGITAGDCLEVTDAVDATEMNRQPLAGPAPEAPVCGVDEIPVDLFFDDLENTGSGNWANGPVSGTEDEWYYPQNPNPYIGFDATYATSGRTNMWGYDVGAAGDYAIAQTRDTAISDGAVYLRFDHSYAFDDDPSNGTRYDGGLLEYSVDGGTNWIDAGPLFTHNGYNDTIARKERNPLGGRPAFTAESYGYISSRVDLSSLAGQRVRFRFRIGTGTRIDDYGWFVDDVRIYRCDEPADTTPPDAPQITDTDPDSPANDNSPEVKGTAEAGSTVALYSNADCSGTALVTGSAANFASSGITVSVGDNTTTLLRATATDSASNTSSCSPSFTYTEDSIAPATTIDSAPPDPTNDSTPSFTFFANEAPVTFQCRVDGEAFATCTSPHTTAALVDGARTFEVRAVDTAGNTDSTPARSSFTVDTKAPATTISFPVDSTSYTSVAHSAGCSDATPDACGTASDAVGIDGVEVSIQRDSDDAYWNGVSWQAGQTWPAADGTSAWTYDFDPAEDTYTLSARATDTAGNVGGADSADFTIDDTAPSAPQITDTDPDSPANDNSPEVKGAAEAGSTVEIYSTADCSGSAMATGSASDFFSPGITVSVTENTTTRFRATATDAAGNRSPCSDAFEYTEDSFAPEPPVFASTEPASPADENRPLVKGTATGTVHIYSTNDCIGTPVDGSAATFSNPGIEVTVADNTTTTFHATAEDGVGNISACSASSITYTEDSTAPQTTIDSGPPDPTNDSTPSFTFSADEAPVTFQCSVDGDLYTTCFSPLTTDPLDDGPHALEVQATDRAGNTDATPARSSFTVDTEAPDAPQITDTDPDSPASDNAPEVKGSAEADSTVRLYAGVDCSGPVLDTGSSTEFTSPGLTPSPQLNDDSPTALRATATDAAGNASACSGSFVYVEDSTPPDNPTLASPSHVENIPSNDPTIDVTFTGADDSLSGLSGFSYLWDTSPTTPPARAKDADESATDTTSPSLLDGDSHYVHLRTVDNAGNWSEAVHLGPFVIDTRAPETTIESGPPDPTNDSTPSFEFSSDDPLADFDCRVDSDAFARCTSLPHTTVALSDGPHTFEVQATDAAGNIDSTPARSSFMVDTRAPDALQINDTDPDSPANDNSPEVKGAAEAGSTVEIYSTPDCSGNSLVSGSAEDFDDPGLTVSVGDDTTTHLRATATDAAGNTSACSEAIQYIEDSMPPSVQVTFPLDSIFYTSSAYAAGCADATPDLCGSASDAVGVDGVEVSIQRDSDDTYWNGTSWQAGRVWLAADGTSPWTFDFDPAEDTYTQSARTTDTAGNVGSGSSISFAIENSEPPPPDPEPGSLPDPIPVPDLIPPDVIPVEPPSIAPKATIPAGVAPVKGGVALLRMRCAGGDTCRGTVRLIAWVRSGTQATQSRRFRTKRRSHGVLIGKRRFSVAPKATRVIRVRLTRRGRALLHKSGRRGLRARLRGSGLRSRTVMLRPRARRQRS